VNHYKAQMQQGTARRGAQLQLHKHKLTAVSHQVVAGSNYKLTLSAEHVSTGEHYEMQGIVHCDVSGQHSVKYFGTARKKDKAAIQSVAETTSTATPTPAEVQGGGTESGTAKASTTAAGIQANTPGNVESNNKVHIPTWAIWLSGTTFIVFIVLVIGLLYNRSTKRRRSASRAAVELDEENLRSRAPSLEAIDIMVEGPAVAQASDIEERAVSSPRIPVKSSTIRARAASQEGVICLD